jgi:hypothetical protein
MRGRGETKRRRRTRNAHPAKLPYGGLNRIRFEGCVSTTAGGPARYPRFGVHFTMHGGRGPAKAPLSSRASSWSGACFDAPASWRASKSTEEAALHETRRRRDPRLQPPCCHFTLSDSFTRNFIRTDFARNYLMQKAYEVSGYAPHWWLTPAGTAWSSAAMTQRNNHSQTAIARPQSQAVVLRAGLITLATLALITVLVLITGSTSAGYGFA